MNDLATMAMEQLLESKRKADALFAQIKSLAKREPNEPRIKVSPYAKFDKLHKKNRKINERN